VCSSDLKRHLNGMLNRKIRICHVANNDSAVRFLLLNQLAFLQKEGYDVSVACCVKNSKEDIEQKGIKVKSIIFSRSIFSFKHAVAFVQLYVYFKKEKFDIIHTHNPIPGLLGQVAAKLAGVRIIINTVHGLYFTDDTSGLERGCFILAEKIAAKCSNLIFSQNKEDIKTLIKEKIAEPDKIKYLGNGVDVDKFSPAKFSEEFIANKKRELGISEDYKILGTIGRLVEEKGYLDLFVAFKSVLHIFPKTILLIVGPEDTDKRDALKASIVKEYSIENNVLFLGERTDVSELLGVMDIFILASHREGMPRSLIEAMVAARPAITTDIRGCREIVDNGENGALVPVKDPERLSQAVVSLLSDPERAKIFGKSARLKAEKRFDERLVFDMIRQEYQKLILAM
jgi:glycosyltransferase involved in cell wall biosynthesis